MVLSSAALRRVHKELAELQTSPPEGIRIQVDEANLAHLVGWIEGPEGTPFHGGYFKVKINLADSDFPNTPPKCTMATKIFHPNVAPSTGEICVSTLKKDWKREYGISHILVTVKCLLIHPNPESALHEEAGKLLLEAYDDYARHARLMTDVHARHRPSEFTTVSSAVPKASTSSSSHASTSTSRPAASATSQTFSTLANNENDSGMHYEPSIGSSTSASSMMKTSSASGGMSGGVTAHTGLPGSLIPKKRPPPSGGAGTGTPLSSFGNSLPPQANASAVFGAINAAAGNVITAAAGPGAVPIKKTASSAAAGAGGAAAQKKRGLKRL